MGSKSLRSAGQKLNEKQPAATRRLLPCAVFILVPLLLQGKETFVAQHVYYRTKQVDGINIFYRESGPKDAPTILLRHGLPSSSRMFEPLFARLSDRFHLVAPDYPGFGHSDCPSQNNSRTRSSTSPTSCSISPNPLVCPVMRCTCRLWRAGRFSDDSRAPGESHCAHDAQPTPQGCSQTEVIQRKAVELCHYILVKVPVYPSKSEPIRAVKIGTRSSVTVFPQCPSLQERAFVRQGPGIRTHSPRVVVSGYFPTLSKTRIVASRIASATREQIVFSRHWRRKKAASRHPSFDR